MKTGINKVTVVGNVGEEPRINQNGKANVANLSLATNEFYKDKEGNEVKKTEWHRIVAWDWKADLLSKYVKKGDPLYVEGKLRTNSWEDKEGNKKYSTEIVAENILFFGSRE